MKLTIVFGYLNTFWEQKNLSKIEYLEKYRNILLEYGIHS